MFRQYVEHGWALCALDRQKKSPSYGKWNERPIDADIADAVEGAGILHVQSGTCALDVDNLTLARGWLAERGVDLDALLNAANAVRISSGRKGRAKLLYRLKTPLRTFKPTGSGVELRCATAAGKSVHDALPPTIHPDTGKPYEWLYPEPLIGDWRTLPPIPATLLAAWRQLLAEAPAEPRAARTDTDVELQKLHRWIEDQDPNQDYDAWVRVGMKLHDATGGAEEGLAIWQDWSAKATRKFKQPANCRVHWVSFESAPGKVVATLDHELPADADEFEIITEAAASPTPAEAKAQQTKATQRQAAIDALEKRLVYVAASEKYFDTSRHRLIGSEAAIEHLFTSSMPLGRNGRLNPVKVLKASTTKRVLDGLGFHPGEGAIFTAGEDTFANNYRNRLPEPLKPTPEEAKKIEWIFDRIEDAEYRDWLKQLYAHVIQKPGVKIKSAPLIWSETQRNGKSTIIKTIPSLLVGSQYSQDVDNALLMSNFNDYLQDAWHINLAEFRAGSRGERTMIGNKLKGYIADDTVPLHPKGGRGYTLPNHFFVTASSNDEDAASIDNNDERWGIYEFKQPKFTHAERQAIYHEFLLTPRAAAVLRWYFLHVKLNGFHPGGSAPMTEAKRDMAEASTPADKELLTLMFEEHAQFFSKDIVLVSEVLPYVHKHCVARPSAARIGKILARAPFNGIAYRFRVGAQLYRGVIIRNHDKWRAMPGELILDHIQGNDDDIDLLS